MKNLCEKLNACIPCKSQSDVDTLTSLLAQHIDSDPKQHIYWSKEILLDTGSNEDLCLSLLLKSSDVIFVPSKDQIKHPGVVVRYKHEITSI